MQARKASITTWSGFSLRTLSSLLRPSPSSTFQLGPGAVLPSMESQSPPVRFGRPRGWRSVQSFCVVGGRERGTRGGVGGGECGRSVQFSRFVRKFPIPFEEDAGRPTPSACRAVFFRPFDSVSLFDNVREYFMLPSVTTLHTSMCPGSVTLDVADPTASCLFKRKY